ncbi:MAG: hypothetical protein ACXADF_14495 [Candidatus Thorarchaeota archaeon]|jgi:hypothetical protein
MREHLDLFRRFNVISVGWGRKKVGGSITEDFAVMVGVPHKFPLSWLRPQDVIPASIDGIPTDVIETGLIERYGYTKRMEIPQPGTTVGHIGITAGTLGAIILDEYDEPVLLSNAHVFTPDPTLEEIYETEILHPGPADGGKLPEDVIGYYLRHVPIKLIDDFISTCPVSTGIAGGLTLASKGLRRQSRFHASAEPPLNLVDAAIARPAPNKKFDPRILEIGEVIGTSEAFVDMPVIKTGRTTGLTHGYVAQTDVTVQVGYGGNRLAMFTDQVLIETNQGGIDFSQPGDSGSLIVEEYTNKAVAHLFAGGQGVTIGNLIRNTEEQLNVKF